MKKLLLFAAMLLFISGTISCQDNGGDPVGPDVPTKTGQVKISLSTVGAFNGGGAAQQYSARAAGDVSLEEIKVEIYNAEGSVVKRWEKANEIPEFFSLNVGAGYKIVAYNRELQSLAFDAPCYRGEQTFDVKTGQIVPIDLVCKLNNMMVSINLSQAFLVYFGSDYEIIIRNEDYVTEGDPQLVLLPGESRACYLKVAPFKVIIKAKGLSQVKEISTVQAQDHHIIDVDLVPIGSVNVKLKIDTSVNNKNVGIIVPGEDEDLGNGGKPKPDNPGGGEGGESFPSIEGLGFNIDRPLTLSTARDFDGEVCKVPVKALVSAEGEIDSLRVRIDSPSLGMDLLEPMFGGDTFDLANLDEKSRENLIMVGLLKESDVINGSKEFLFNVTGFMSLLPVPEEPAYHKFHITLVDKKGNKITKILTVDRVE